MEAPSHKLSCMKNLHLAQAPLGTSTWHCITVICNVELTVTELGLPVIPIDGFNLEVTIVLFVHVSHAVNCEFLQYNTNYIQQRIDLNSLTVSQ